MAAAAKNLAPVAATLGQVLPCSPRVHMRAHGVLCDHVWVCGDGCGWCWNEDNG